MVIEESRPPAEHRAEEAPPTPGSSGSRLVRLVLEWVAIIGVALMAAFLIKTFLVQAFYIPSASMESTLLIGDRVLVNKMSYRLHEVNRGDLVVFERPPGEIGDPRIKDLIKRVVGLEGETVEGRNGSVFVDGRRLPESYLPDGITTSDFQPKKIPADHIWVMGDNRSNSKDSRFFDAISEDLIVGRAFVRVWPFKDFSLF